MENWAAVAARGLLGKRGLPELDLRALTAMCGEFTGGKDVLHAALSPAARRASRVLTGRFFVSPPGEHHSHDAWRRVARTDPRFRRLAFWPLLCCMHYSWRPRLPHECIEHSQTTAAITTIDISTAGAIAGSDATAATLCTAMHWTDGCQAARPRTRGTRLHFIRAATS